MCQKPDESTAFTVWFTAASRIFTDSVFWSSSLLTPLTPDLPLPPFHGSSQHMGCSGPGAAGKHGPRPRYWGTEESLGIDLGSMWTDGSPKLNRPRGKSPSGTYYGTLWFRSPPAAGTWLQQTPAMNCTATQLSHPKARLEPALAGNAP